MADNVTLTNNQTSFEADTNADFTSAADEIGAAKYQRVKLTLGADGVNDGDVASGNPMPIEGDVIITGTPTVSIAEQSGATAQANITAINQSVNFSTAVTGAEFNGVQLTGTWTGTVQVQGSINGTDFVQLTVQNLAGVAFTDITSNGIWFVPGGGWTTLRVRSTAWTSGTLTVNWGQFLTGDGGKVLAHVTNSLTVGLPTGASTEAKQDTQITSLQLLDDAVATDGSAVLTKLYQVGGTDGTNAQTMAVSTAGNPLVAGDIAHDSADSGNPIKTGAKAYDFDGTVPGTAVTEGDRANSICDVYGRTFVETAHPRYFSATENHATAQTNNELVAAPGAGLSLYITDIIVSNGATAGTIKFVGDTGGTPVTRIEVLYLAINGGAPIQLKQPLKIATNTNFGFTSATVTTHTIFVSGYIAP